MDRYVDREDGHDRDTMTMWDIDGPDDPEGHGEQRDDDVR
jgi:hypothetical protein